jgi:hypothetical protein
MTTWLELNYPDSSIDDWDQATVIQADTYHTDRGNTDWSGTEIAKTQALQRAWDYLRGRQWLDDVFDTELPTDILNAQIVGALAELTTPGVLQPELTADNFLESKNLAGAIVKTYRGSAPTGSVFTAMDSLLQKYVYSGGCRIVRA